MTTLISTNDVIDYSVFDVVKNRGVALLTYDIIQAQADIFDFVGHKFDDQTKYANLPEEVKLAFIKVAEYYALINSDESAVKGIKSEKIGDYSYSLGDERKQTFSLSTLLSGHVQSTGKTGLRLRFRGV